MVEIEWTDEAIKDFQRIINYLAQDDSEFAIVFKENLLDKVEMLSKFPRIGRPCFFSKDPTDREIFLFAYRIIYNYKNDKIMILNIVHTSRAI
jgi:plasmid stabilization system protein ParE